MKNYFTPRRLYMALAVLCGLAIAFGIFIRFYHLGFPNKQVFDEVYFPVFAQKYIDGVNFYDVHPPMGKFVIAVGMLMFGDNPIGWRVMPMLFGIGIIGLLAHIYWLMFKDKVGAWILAGLVALDGMFIIYSRVGLMDGILFFFTFATFLAARKLQGFWRIFWVATLLGLAIAIKWPSLALVVPIFFFARREQKVPEVIVSLIWSAVVYFAIVYAGQLLIHVASPLSEAWNWNFSAGEYHLTITATHPWGSKWWSWPLLLKPVLFLYDAAPGDKLQVMTTLGNPVVWWLSTASVLISSVYLVFRRIRFREFILEHPLTPFILGFFAFWLPWVPVRRVLFLYHYFPAYGFALFILTYWLAQLWKKSPGAVLGIMAIFLAISVYFLPFSIGWWSLSKPQVDQRTWISSWL